MSEVASAYVSLMPSAKGFGKALEGQIGSPVTKAGKSVGAKLMAGIKGTAVGLAASAGGVLATALFKGWGRLTAIENAQAKLTGLGNSAKSVQKIMDNALGAVKGTAFGLDEAATVAAGAVAAGVKPGKQLRRTLGLTADAATIAGVSMGEMGAVFNKVASANKIQGDVINQLNDAGIPIVQLLGKAMGKTSAQVTKLASKGKIDFATFQKAMQTGLGGAALKSGQTTVGAFKNMGAALSRFGAQMLSGVFPVAKQVFGGITGLLDKMSGSVGSTLGSITTGLVSVGAILTKGWFSGASNTFGLEEDSKVVDILFRIHEGFVSVAKTVKNDVIPAVAGFLSSARAALPDLLKKLAPLGAAAAGFGLALAGAVKTAAPALLQIGKALLPLGKTLAVAGVAALTVAFRALAPVVTTTGDVIARIGDLVAAHATTFRVLAAAIGVGIIGWKAYKKAVLATKAVQATIAAVKLGLTAATYGEAGANVVAGLSLKVYKARLLATKIATTAMAAATKAWAAVQWALNAAMSANPIGLIIAGIALLVAGFVVAYKHSEKFRKIVDATWTGIKAVVSAVVSWFTTTLPAAFKSVVSAISGFITQAGQIMARILNVITYPMRLTMALAATIIYYGWEAVKRPIIAALAFIGKIISTAWKAYTGLVRTELAIIKAVVGAVWGGVKAVTSVAWKAISAVIGAAVGAVKRRIDTMVSIVATVAGFFGRVNSAVSGKIRDLLKMVGGLGKDILSKIGDFGSLLAGAGVDLITGLWHGITSMGPWLARKLQEFVTDKIPGPIKKALGISSPSKVMAREVGRWIPLGLAKGIDSQADKVAASMRSLVQTPQTPLPAFAGTQTGATQARGPITFNIHEQSDPRATADAVLRRQAFAGV